MIVVLESLDEYTKGVQAQLLYDALSKKSGKAKLCQSVITDRVKNSIKSAWSNLERVEDAKKSVYTSTILSATERYLKVTADIGEIKPEDIIIFDNYSCTNIIKRMSSIEVAEWDKYIEWAIDVEHNKIGVPEPDLTIYLSIDTVAYKVEGEKLNNMVQKSSAAQYCANKLGWTVVDCCRGGAYRTKESINAEIMKIVSEYYNLNCDINGNKKYCYYITYSKAGQGFGSVTINYDKQINTPERIKEVGELLSKRLKGKCVIINALALNGSEEY